MLYHKRGGLFAAAAISLAVALVFTFWAGLPLYASSESGGSGMSFLYEEKLFGDTILSIDLTIDPADWAELLANASAEEYYPCDVTIDGETFSRVGLRAKGNTSLSSIASDPTTDRYSFKLEFDHYIGDQTCYGLDKLILNNNYSDATSIKEAIVYDLFAFLGADASLYNYAKISVNGEYWGVYLALEAVEESFLLRNYGTTDGKLYKPDSMEIGGGNGGDPGNGGFRDFGGGRGQNAANGRFGDGESPGGDTDFTLPGGAALSAEAASQNKKDRSGGFNGRDTGGATLEYTDDNLSSYETIWDGAINDSDDSDHARVVVALKKAAEGTDLAEALDLDNLLKYMAAHIFVENADSLSGNMAHNYYLYERGGRLNLLPWDYNLAFGGMGGSAADTVNGAIDYAFAGTSFFDPIYADEALLAVYHGYLRRICEEYVGGGEFEKTYRRLRAMIDEPTAADPTAFYTAEEYEAAVETLYRLISLRAESVLGQLDGTIPATDAGQAADPSALVDTSGLQMN
ncbi:MAG: CotH kinase family protein, partial [Eubacterium sp.]|nr:CotH kinase family protein [Eubacterium sp.]